MEQSTQRKKQKVDDSFLPKTPTECNPFGYTFMMYPSPLATQFVVGDDVWVFKKNKIFAKARILQSMETDSSSEFFGRYKVGYIFGDNSTYHCKPERMVEKCTKQVIVCSNTKHYRREAKMQTDKEDSVIEIGSAMGSTTSLLASRCKIAIGIDKSEEQTAIAKKDFPDIQFLIMDVLYDSTSFFELVKKNNINKLFIDINGNRPLQTVLRLLELVQKNLDGIGLIVVKSSELNECLMRRWNLRAPKTAQNSNTDSQSSTISNNNNTQQ